MFILQTKLQPPELPQQVVGRPRLTASFSAGSPSAEKQPRFVGIFAPAGYGKTTLVLQLLQQRDEPALLAWFSIDATDNYFTGFWRYVWAAVFGRESKIDSTAPGTTAFHAPLPQWLDESQPEQIAAALIQSLAEKELAQSSITLVLDDFHHIQRQSILRSLAYLVDFAPTGLNVLMTSRSEPSLPLARWKIKRYARTVYAADLVFTTEEIRSWFGDDCALEALESASGGWAAALRLIESNAGSPVVHRQVIGGLDHTLDQEEVDIYVAEEVLAELPEDLLQFVLDMAHFERFSLELCSLVRDDTNAHECLKELLKRRLFIVALDEQGQWYRFHELFRSGALYLLRSDYPLRYEKLLIKTVAALIDTDCYLEAVQYLFLRERFLEAADTLESIGNHVLRRGYHEQVLGWLHDLPMELINGRPRLLLIRAWCLFFDNRFQAVTDTLDQMQLAFPELFSAAEPQGDQLQGADSLLKPELRLLAAYVDRFSGHYEQARVKTIAALQELQHIDVPMKSLACFGLANDAYVTSDLAEASAQLRRAILEAKVEQRYSTYLSSIGLHVWILAARGFGEEALTLKRSAVKWISEFHRTERDPNVVSCWLNSGLVLIHSRSGDVLQAQAALAPMLEFVEGAEAQQQVFTWFVQARLALLQREFSKAAALTHQACRILASAGDDTRALAPPLDSLLNEIHLHVWRHSRSTDSAENLGKLRNLPNPQWSTSNNHLLTGADNSLIQGQYQLLLAIEHSRAGGIAAAAIARDAALVHARALMTLIDGKDFCFYEFSGRILLAIALSGLAGGERDEAAAGHLLAAAAIAATHRLTACGLLFAEELLALFGALKSSSASINKEQQSYSEWLATLQRWIAADSSDIAAVAQGVESVEPDSAAGFVQDGQRQQTADTLSQRELEVLALIDSGLPNKRIASDLNLAPATIKAHIRNIYGKLGASRRTEALNIARGRGLLKG